MPATINWSMNAQVVGGPRLSAASAATAEAYDVIDIEIATGVTDREVEIQPSSPGRVTLLMITSSLYDTAPLDETPLLSYTVDADTTVIRFDAPQLFLGAGIMALFGGGPGSILLTNNTGLTVSVRVLIGRDATP